MSANRPLKEADFKDIIDYYDHTRLDYKYAWDNSLTPAVHFGYYDEQASKHDDALMNTNRVLAERVNIKAGEKVLDAGCGKGGSSFWLAINKEVEAVGITPVKSQIADCLAQAQKLNLENKTSFVQADYCDTPFSDKTFDVVWACESLCHAKDKSKFYAEAYRLLKSGGRIIIAEYLRDKRPLENNGEHLLKSWLNRWAIEDIDSKEEHFEHARQAGFENIQIENVTDNMKISLRNLYNNSRKWFWLSRIFRAIGTRSKGAHENMRASIIQYEALQEKLWNYAFISAVKTT